MRQAAALQQTSQKAAQAGLKHEKSYGTTRILLLCCLRLITSAPTHTPHAVLAASCPSLLPALPPSSCHSCGPFICTTDPEGCQCSPAPYTNNTTVYSCLTTGKLKLRGVASCRETGYKLPAPWCILQTLSIMSIHTATLPHRHTLVSACDQECKLLKLPPLVCPAYNSVATQLTTDQMVPDGVCLLLCCFSAFNIR
jgi:hypothetical protein